MKKLILAPFYHYNKYIISSLLIICVLLFVIISLFSINISIWWKLPVWAFSLFLCIFHFFRAIQVSVIKQYSIVYGLFLYILHDLEDQPEQVEVMKQYEEWYETVPDYLKEEV